MKTFLHCKGNTYFTMIHVILMKDIFSSHINSLSYSQWCAFYLTIIAPISHVPSLEHPHPRRGTQNYCFFHYRWPIILKHKFLLPLFVVNLENKSVRRIILLFFWTECMECGILNLVLLNSVQGVWYTGPVSTKQGIGSVICSTCFYLAGYRSWIYSTCFCLVVYKECNILELFLSSRSRV